MGAEREQPGMPGWQATAACRGRLGTPARGSQELPTAQHFSAWMAWRQMPAPPFPPCCGPRLHIPVPLPSWGCSLPQLSWSSCLRGTPLTDPHPRGIAPSTSKKYTCTWNTISFCFKWAESLRGHPAPPGEKSRQALPVSPWPLPPWDNVPPTLHAVPPSPGWLSLPRTSAWLESAAWPHVSSACPVCPRLDPGEAPNGGIWKRAKALSTNTPEPSLCSPNQPWQHQLTWTDLWMWPVAHLARACSASDPCAKPWHGCWSEEHQRAPVPSPGARVWGS